MKKIIFTSVFCIVSLLTLSAQREKNGAATIASNKIVNEYTILTSNIGAGSSSISVANSALNSNGRFIKSLASGDLIMIIQMQGATIKGTVQDSTWGDVTAYNNCGLYEFREVATVPNGTSINLTCPLVNTYTASGNVEIIRVPRYSSLTINTNDTIQCDSWNGQTGGIITVEVFGTATINGAIDASKKGFRGGILQNQTTPCCTGTDPYFFYIFNVDSAAQKGEGIAGYQASYTVYGGQWSIGAAANAGGGGDAWNAGGGGGANGGAVSAWVNGFGVPDISKPGYVTAWNLEYSWMSSFVGSGGGRGGYSYARSTSTNPTTLPPGNTSWGGDDHRSVGGRGGRPLDYSTGRLFLGGGGGAGDEDNSNGGSGGIGGGLIDLISYGTVSGAGTIIANGQNGASSNIGTGAGGAGDAAGGGGGGGTIVINSTGNISGISISANGGSGGSQVTPAGGEVEGPGGGGGGGYIATTNAVPENVMGGINGTTTVFATSFPANGALMGGDGTTTIIPDPITTIQASNAKICSGTSATLTATLGGTIPPGTSIVWLDSTGTTVLGSGNPFITPVITSTTVYKVGFCPGNYLTQDTVSIVKRATYIKAIPDSIVAFYGQTVSLSAIGDSGWYWSPSAGLSCTYCTSPQVVVDSNTTYYVIVGDGKNCSAIDSVRIEVSPTIYIPTAFTPNGDGLNDIFRPSFTGYVSMDALIFNRWGQNIYHWNTLNGGWNGTHNGVIEQEDIYIYSITAVDYRGHTISKIGRVSLLK